MRTTYDEALSCRFEIGDHARIHRIPSQRLLGVRAGRLKIGTHEVRQEAKVLGGFRRRYRYNRNVEDLTNHLGDLSQSNAVLRNRVISASCCSLFQSDSVKMSGIEPMDCGPAIDPVTDIRRDASLSR
jgi:hypothetical protein